MLPREIVSETWPDRATYDLPRRPIGKLRLFGLPLIGFAVLFAWSPGHEVASLVWKAIQGTAGAGDWLVGSFTFLFVAAAAVPFGLGMFVLLGRTRLVVTPRRIRVIECAGPLRWSRSLRLDSVVGLEVGYARNTLEAQRSATSLPQGFLGLGALVAKKRYGKPVFLLMGYPRDWLDPMAAELATILGTFGQRVQVKEVSPRAVPVLAAFLPEIRQKPENSRIEMNESGSGVELRVPSTGFFKQSHGLFVFGMIWCLMTAGFSFAMTGGHFRSLDSEAMPFLLIFWCLGLGMVGFGLDLGTCQWSLKADRQSLEVTRRSLLRKRTWKWRRPELARITVGPSGVSVNEEPLQEVQVFSVSGARKGLLRGRDVEELGWVAFLLNQTLDLGTAAQPVPEPIGRDE